MAENTIPYSTVTGSFGQLLGDYDISDMSPDIKRMSGTVVLTPSIKYVRVNGTLLELKPVQGRIVNGEVLDRLGNGPLTVFPTNAEISGIHGWYWKAKVSIPGARIPLIMFYAPAGGSVNLSDQAKGVSGAAVEYIEGPPGPAGPPGEDGVGVVGAESTGYGKFALNLSDGTKSTEIVLPSPETPYQTAVRNGYVGTEAQWVASNSGSGISDDLLRHVYASTCALSYDYPVRLWIAEGEYNPDAVVNGTLYYTRRGVYVTLRIGVSSELIPDALYTLELDSDAEIPSEIEHSGDLFEVSPDLSAMVVNDSGEDLRTSPVKGPDTAIKLLDSHTGNKIFITTPSVGEGEKISGLSGGSRCITSAPAPVGYAPKSQEGSIEF